MKLKNKKNIIEVIAEEKRLTIVKRIAKYDDIKRTYSHIYPTVEQMQDALKKYIGNRQAEGYRVIE